MDKKICFCETVHTTPHKNAQKRRFLKTLFKVDIQKTEVFENAVDQCERTKTDKNKNAETATTPNSFSMAPISTKRRREKMEDERYLFFLLANPVAAITCLSKIVEIMSHMHRLHQARRKKFSIAMRSKSFVLNQKYAKTLSVPRRFWIRPGRTNLWWKNLITDKMVNEEWKENFRLTKGILCSCAKARTIFEKTKNTVQIANIEESNGY